MAFNSELGGEFATSKDVRVCERGLALSVYEGGAVLFYICGCVLPKPPPTSLF